MVDHPMIRTSLPDFILREASLDDVPLILCFIRELGEYEKLSAEIVATEEILRENLFGERRTAEVILGYLKGAPVSFAVFFHNFSTFLGRPGIYLEDLFVKPEARGLGIGKIMLSYLAKLAVERGCGRLEWSVLDWNESAVKFYRSVDALSMDGWTVQRVTGDALTSLAQRFDIAR
jgi:ribosomal protein S18 acetylase RimI-like enzyme